MFVHMALRSGVMSMIMVYWNWKYIIIILVYLWQISQNSKNSDLCVAEGWIFSKGTQHILSLFLAARGCSPVSMSGHRTADVKGWDDLLDQPARGDLHGSTCLVYPKGPPTGWWMLPTGASGAIFKFLDLGDGNGWVAEEWGLLVFVTSKVCLVKCFQSLIKIGLNTESIKIQWLITMSSCHHVHPLNSCCLGHSPFWKNDIQKKTGW